MSRSDPAIIVKRAFPERGVWQERRTPTAPRPEALAGGRLLTGADLGVGGAAPCALCAVIARAILLAVLSPTPGNGPDAAEEWAWL
ncbi:MAG: hypothetical protein JWM36_2455 [Hyphomicrobiales bacterium]|nr:hypothetical protein [Hyphomicrobiales bacterium]